ncbi:MAG: hypothetical protein LUC33_00990 [Prevotellaceae bacterium]|nr:hypothetical protein [Prevotellaceae bacterium]
MGIEGYDYPPEDRYSECGRCRGTGRIWHVARSDGEGDVDMETYHEVDRAAYDRAADVDDAPKGTWVQCDDDTCPDCGGEGWIDERERRAEEEEAYRCERYEAEREERAIREYLKTHGL